MRGDRVIPEALWQAIMDYIADGSVSTSKTWAEVRGLLFRFQSAPLKAEDKPEEEK